MSSFGRAAGIIRDGIASHAFPAATVHVGSRDAVLWQEAFGTLSYAGDAEEATLDTIFDLASLTKIVATTTLAMRALDDGLLRVDDLVAEWIPEWRGANRRDVTIRDLLAHRGGLTAYLPYHRNLTGRPEFQHAIATEPLEYAQEPGDIFDLGFILLGFILEDARTRAYGKPTGPTDPSSLLAAQFCSAASFLTSEPLTFNPPRHWRTRIAPTEHDSWRGRTLIGEVHDENAWALGGAAGHSGLFGTAGAVGAFARATLHTIGGTGVLSAPGTIREFIRRTDTPGGSRALGWDTMLPTSSCGTLMSRSAIGHTGFTGTSLWIDWERDLYVALLTNRVHPTRDNQAIREIRPRFHDSVIEGLRILNR